MLRTLYLSAGAALLSFSMLTHAAPAQPSAEDVERAKRLGASVSATAVNAQAYQYTAEGNIATDSDGTPIAANNSQDALRNSGKQFQQMLGITEINTVSSPANKNKTGRVDIATENSADFSCAAPVKNKLISAGSVVLNLQQCEGGASVASVTAKICDNKLKNGFCAQSSDFGGLTRLTVGAFSTYNGQVSVGLNCNQQLACRITVRTSASVGGSAESMRERAGQANSAAGDSAISAQLSNAMITNNYVGKLEQTGQDLKDLKNSAANQSARQGTGAQSCATTRTCLKEATSVQEFTRSCSRTFPLTERLTNYQFSDTATCTVVSRAVDNKAEVTNSCATEELKNKVLVAKSAEVCSEKKLVSGNETCVATSVTEYWANTTNGQVQSQTTSPADIGGACDTRANSETRISTCGGAWFGRTLPDAECAVVMRDESTGAISDAIAELTFQDKPGCGFCLNPRVGETCYAKPAATSGTAADTADSCELMDLSGCTFKNATPETFSGDGGLVTSQKENYTCKKQTAMCVQWSQGPEDTCFSTDSALGLDSTNKSGAMDGALTNAMVSAEIANSVAKGMEKGGTQEVPKIFAGEDMRCQRAIGALGQIQGRNCCRTNLERPIEDQGTRDGCSLKEAELAAARRSSYTVYVGDYCSKEIKLLWSKKCIERTQTYCNFSGLLPRIIQEQGRQQLADIANSSAGSNQERTSLDFRYYHADEGGWAPPVNVNGVTMTAWQWPSYCTTPEKAGEILFANPDAKSCPGMVTTWFAACDNPNGCGELPREPSEGSGFWQLQEIDPLRKVTNAVSRYSVVSGACTPETQICNYTISAWPVGQGGKAVVTKDLTWQLYGKEQLDRPTGDATPQQYQMNNVGDLMFKGYSLPGKVEGKMPSAVQIDVSRDGGQTWRTHQIPTNTGTEQVPIPNSDIALTGYCDEATNMCRYKATGTTTVTAKPMWGSPKSPDCSGFTAGQLSALDFSKMDLSEWLNSVMERVAGSAGAAGFASQAHEQVRAYNSAMNGGSATVTASKPTSANFARAVPSEGFGPFNVKLAVAGYWPEVTGDPNVDTDKVLSVQVDWGDCSAVANLPPVSTGGGFAGTHRYEAPDSDNHSCMGSKSSRKRNLTHTVTLTVSTSKSGVQVRKVYVENAWAVFPGGKHNNDFYTEKVTVPTNQTGQQYPSPSQNP